MHVRVQDVHVCQHAFHQSPHVSEDHMCVCVCVEGCLGMNLVTSCKICAHTPSVTFPAVTHVTRGGGVGGWRVASSSS